MFVARRVSIMLLLSTLLSACGDSGAPSSRVTAPPSTPATPQVAVAKIKVLSNRHDLISAGDALVEIIAPQGIDPATARIEVGSRDISDRFAETADGRFIGRVEGLALGKNTLTAAFPGGAHATAVLTNHPNGGPIFAGPQLQPWTCQSSAVDKQCNQPAEYTFLYRSTDSSKYELQPYDPADSPSDVAMTTTDQGVTVPFIVRVERGFQDRDEYKILMLYQPGQPWEPASPQKQWNRKLVIPGGFDCRANYAAGNAGPGDPLVPPNPVVTQHFVIALARGFAVMNTALSNLGHNCTLALQAESLMMAKERLIEQYGELRYTIGTGCSGGSIVQYWVANAYPGIYDGLVPSCSYPDVWSPLVQFTDYYVMRAYLDDPARWAAGVSWNPQQMADIEGHFSIINSVGANEGARFVPGIPDPTSACNGITPEQRYHPQTNPGGVRCGLLDYNISHLGPRPAEVWSASEKLLGKGFAGSPFDNVGIQYGLNALRELKITPAHFVDLNVKMGGIDIDWKRTAKRSVADSLSLANAYRGGLVNDTSNLNLVPIINATGPDPVLAHDSVHTWWTRWRLEREHGTHDNMVIWGGPVALLGDPYYISQGMLAMDRWLAAIEQDKSAAPLARKIVTNRPADIHDQCSDGAGHKVLDDLCPAAIVPVHSTPRAVAGDVRTADTMRCQLKSLTRGSLDYGPVPFTDEQWAQLQAAFPNGVCDYGKPALDVAKTVPWLNFIDAGGRAIYGGSPMPSVPIGEGWASPSFRK